MHCLQVEVGVRSDGEQQRLRQWSAALAIDGGFFPSHGNILYANVLLMARPDFLLLTSALVAKCVSSGFMGKDILCE